MKREMRLIALILEFVEAAVKTTGIPLPDFKEYSICQVEYHVKLCEEARYLDIEIHAHSGNPLSIIRMTWEGHEALDRLLKR